MVRKCVARGVGVAVLMGLACALLLTQGLKGQQVEGPKAGAEPYSVVHGWPELPMGFVLGQVSGVAVDSHNHVFVFHRAENSWAADKTHVIASMAVRENSFPRGGKTGSSSHTAFAWIATTTCG